MRRVAALSLCRHLSLTVFADDGPVAQYLRGAVRYPRPLLILLRSAWFEGAVLAPPVFEAALWLAPTGAPIRCSAWAELVARLGGDHLDRGIHRPFLGSETRLGMFVFLLDLFDVGVDAALEIARTDGLAGVRLDAGDEGRRLPLYATLNYERFCGSEPVKGYGPPTGDVAVLLLGEGHKPGLRRIRWVGGRFVEVVGIGDLGALRGVGPLPEGRTALRRNLDRLCEAPELVIDAVRAGLEQYTEVRS